MENLEEELIQDIMETLGSIENYPCDFSEVTVPAPNAEENPGFSSGLSFNFSICYYIKIKEEVSSQHICPRDWSIN